MGNQVTEEEYIREVKRGRIYCWNFTRDVFQQHMHLHRIGPLFLFIRRIAKKLKDAPLPKREVLCMGRIMVGRHRNPHGHIEDMVERKRRLASSLLPYVLQAAGLLDKNTRNSVAEQLALTLKAHKREHKGTK
jgi:hypothetical protein